MEAELTQPDVAAVSNGEKNVPGEAQPGPHAMAFDYENGTNTADVGDTDLVSEEKHASASRNERKAVLEQGDKIIEEKTPEEASSPTGLDAGPHHSVSPTPSTDAADVAPHKPATPYNAFLKTLKDPSCQGVVESIRIFILNFPQSVRLRTDVAGQIHDFLTKTEQELLHTSCYAEASEKEKLNAKEGLEKFVLSKLHTILFQCEDEDALADAFIEKRIRRLSWLTFQHLDLPEIPGSDTLDLAAQELKKLNRTKAPSEKLVLIINCFRVIVAFLERANKTSAIRNSARPSADNILPLLILVLIKANPPNLHSNLEYIGSMRHPDRFVGEDLYAHTQLLSAVSFIRQLNDAEKLNITQADFARLTAEAASSESEKSDEDSKAVASSKKFSSLQLADLTAQLEGLTVSFDGLQHVGHLRIADLDDLFSEYQSMATTLRSVKSLLRHLQHEDATPKKP